MNISKPRIIAIGTLFILCGILILASQYLLGKKNNLFELVNMQLYFNQFNDNNSNISQIFPEINLGNDIVDNPEVPEVPEPEPEPEPSVPSEPVITESYIAVLEIPKINLQKGIYKIGSKYNTVSKNVAILTPSDYPDVEGGNFVLAAHSGSGYLSFFKDLYKLSNDDYAYITYNNIKYTYRITYIYTQPKTGTINVYRPYGKTTLMLITCTKDDDTTQTVYVAVLESTEPI